MSHLMDSITPVGNGTGRGDAPVTIRTARLDDAAGLLRLMRAVDDETPFMIYAKGERSLSVEDTRNLLVEAGLVRGLALFVAQVGPELAGYTLAVSGGLARTRHCVRISALAVRRRWWRQGLGRAMLANVEQWARGMGAQRLELETMAANDAAQGLYESMGFAVEGRRRRAFLVAGAWMDALVMGKLLED
ncbi:acetyltransferase, ribosomal protein N-acetylase [Desulfocurvibacter africanus PCS]|uniref:Acetyltransferase, ribosomal protein N-acetylase n=1 Tax=Desulfocurvibacter africanus PCS TaxID=1262666 RepID=M5Q383_DESAF|nr:GNAT family N-acetyltransferase [Desulfocurvibacter africanus]EMG39136.1 acetyltransferase, ribosomal protein N-acetylase [Desulfocurvibacter africanus PCS]